MTSSFDIRSETFAEILNEDSSVEHIATGFAFTEGPIWVNGYLLFSDIPNSRIVRYHVDEEGASVSTYKYPSGNSNGLTLDHDGNLIACEHTNRRVSMTDPSGNIKAVATRYKGKRLNSPNDVIVKSDGAIYFTDPTYGRMDVFGLLREQDLDFQGVYRIDPNSGDLSLLANDFQQPNGLTFSLDEQQLFVNDTDAGHIRVFEVAEDGSISGGDVWAVPKGAGDGGCDGMKIDSEGNLYCTGPGGLHVYASDATCLGVIEVPEVAANFTWGDDDLQAVYITASTSLYRTRVNIPGRKIS